MGRGTVQHREDKSQRQSRIVGRDIGKGEGHQADFLIGQLVEGQLTGFPPPPRHTSRRIAGIVIVTTSTTSAFARYKSPRWHIVSDSHASGEEEVTQHRNITIYYTTRFHGNETLPSALYHFQRTGSFSTTPLDLLVDRPCLAFTRLCPQTQSHQSIN